MDNQTDYDPRIRYGIFGILGAVLIYFVFIQGQGSTWTMNIPTGTPLVLAASEHDGDNFEHLPFGEEIKVRTTSLNYGHRLDDVRLQVTDPVKVLQDRYTVMSPGMILSARLDFDEQGNLVISQVMLHTKQGFIPVKVKLQTDTKPYVRIMDFAETIQSKF